MTLDFSEFELASDGDGISQKEIRSVLDNPKSRLREIEGYPRAHFYSIEIGYSYKKRFLMVASRIHGGKRQVLQAKVASEAEIEEFYCNK